MVTVQVNGETKIYPTIKGNISDRLSGPRQGEYPTFSNQ